MGISKPDCSMGCNEQHLLISVLERSIEYSCAARNGMTYPHSLTVGLKTHHATVLQPRAGKCPLPRVAQCLEAALATMGELHPWPELSQRPRKAWGQAHHRFSLGTSKQKQGCWCRNQTGRKQLWNMESCKSPRNQWESCCWLCRGQQQDPAMAWNYN